MAPADREPAWFAPTRTPCHMRHFLHEHAAQTTPDGRWFWRDFAAALLCVAVALLIRWRCADHGLTFDERWHLAISTGRGNDFANWPKDTLVAATPSLTSIESAAPLRSVWAPMRAVIHPPLYMFTLRLWREACGDSDWSAAMYSTVWSIAAVVLVFAAVRLQAAVGLATCVGLGMALSPVQAHLGTDVRGYAMMMGLAAFAVWQMVRIESTGATPGRVWLLGLTTCPLMLTHYFAAGTCAAICAWGLVRLRGTLRWHLMAGVAAAAICFAILWLPQALTQLKGVGGVAFLRTTEAFWKSSLPSGIAMPLRLLVYTPRLGFAVACSVVLLAVIAAGVWRRPALLPWLLILVLPIGSLLVLDALRSTKHTSFIRYAAAAAVALPAAPVLAAAALRPAAGWALALGFMALGAAGLGAPRQIGSPCLQRMTKAFLPAITQAPASTPLVIFISPIHNKTFFPNFTLLEWSHVPGFFPRPTMLLAKPRPEELKRLRDASPDGRVWLVSSNQPTDGANKPEWLETLLPSARLVQPPLKVPSGGKKLYQQPPAELWLLELDPPTPAES